MQLDTFNNATTIVGALTGGVTSVERALLEKAGRAQNVAANSVHKVMSSRIDMALANLSNSNSTAITDHLMRTQSHLISRKENINEAITVLSKSLAQVNDIRTHIDYMRKMLTFLENGDLTAAETAIDWDNKLRKINLLARAATGRIKEGDTYILKNLINTNSRDTFKTQKIFAPYTSDFGDLFRIDGVYLGTDYFITENGSGDFWNSDTSHLAFEAQVGTLTEYSSYPNTKTGQYETVETLQVNSYNPSTGAINFTLGGYPQRMSDVESNNTWETAQNMARQAFKIDASNTDIGDTSIPWASISGNINNTASIAAGDGSTQDYDWFKFDLQAGETLTFDVDYGSGMGDDFDSVLDFFDEAGAIADNNSIGYRNTKSPSSLAFNDDNASNTLGGGGSTGSSPYDTYFSTTVATDGTYYVRMRAYDYKRYTTDGAGDYVINVSIAPTASSTGLSGGDIDGIVTGGGLALLDAWIYKNFESQASINQARDALDAAEGLVLTTEAEFLSDRATLESRNSIFSSQVGGLSKEIEDIVEDIQDAARAEVLARQLEYTIAEFDFTLLAARTNTLVQSILISQDSNDFGKSTQENAMRVGITLNQGLNILS